MTGTRRYLVVAEYQRPRDSIAVGTKAYVLFVSGASSVAVVVRDRSGHVRLQPESIDNLASFRIKPVVETSCPRAVWRWAQPSPQRCEELESRCRELRVRTRTPTSNDADE